MNNNGQKLISPKKGIGSKITMYIVILSFLSVHFQGQAQTTEHKGKTNVHTSNGKHVWKRNNGINNFNIEYKGDIEITDDDKDIKSISRGGYLEISKTTFGSKRSLLIEATSDGLRREYYEGRQKQAYEPEGREWLAEILPDIVRSTGIAAESRVKRFYKQGGVNAVLDEIEILDGDYVRSIYGRHLLNMSGLTDDELIKSINMLSEDINSDYYLSQVLKEHSDKYLDNDRKAKAYFEATSNIGSDYYASMVLKEAVKDHKPSPQSISKIMEASKNIGSDYYQSALLSSVLEMDNLTGEILADVIETTKDISSDYYQSQILSKAMETEGLSSKSFQSLMEAISDVSSDYYMSGVFSKMLENDVDENIAVLMIKLVDDKMSSSYYASTVLAKVAEKQESSDKVMMALVNALNGFDSDYYASTVIRKAADHSLSKSSLKSLIEAAGNIGSDYYSASALKSLAPMVRNSDSEVKDAYRSAVKNIGSDTYYGQTMRAID